MCGILFILVGAHQLGFRAPLWLRLVVITSLVVSEALMIPGSVHGFASLLILNWCYVIGVPIGLLFRSWKTGGRFWGSQLVDTVVLAIASVVMSSLYVRPEA